MNLKASSNPKTKTKSQPTNSPTNSEQRMPADSGLMTSEYNSELQYKNNKLKGRQGIDDF